MLQFFGGSSSTTKFTAAPTSGHPTLPVGTGTFGGGATPDFQGTAALGINMATGYTGKLFDAQLAGVSILSISASGNAVLSTGLNTSAIGDIDQSGPFISLSGTTLLFRIRNSGDSVAVVGSSLQTGDIFQVRDVSNINKYAIANVGTGVSPIWAIRVSPTTDADSIAQTHVIGAATGKAIQVVDNAGTTIGWIPLNA